MAALVDYVVEDAPEDADETRRFKYPFVACEVFTCEIDAIFATLLEDEELVAKLFSYLDRPVPLAPLQAGYFSKVVGVLLSRRTVDTMKYLEEHQADILPKLARHIGTTSVLVEVMLRLVGADEQLATFHPNAVTWVADTKLVELVLEQLQPDRPLEVHQNAGLMLQAIARTATGDLSRQLASADVVHRLVDAGLATPHTADEDDDTEVIIQPRKKEGVAEADAEGNTKEAGTEDADGGDENAAPSALSDVVVYPTANQLLAHAAQVLIAILEPRPPPTPMGIDAHMALQGMAGIESVMAEVESELATPEVIEACLESLTRLVPRLEAPSEPAELPTTFTTLKTPLGTHRLRVVELVASLVHVGEGLALDAAADSGAMARCLELFVEFPFNNFLHHPVEAIVASTLENGSDALMSRLLGGGATAGGGEGPSVEMDLVSLLAGATAEPMLSGGEGKAAFRAGNLGHVTSMGNKLVELAATRPSVSELLEADKRWEAWRTEVLEPRNDLENVTKWGCGRPAQMEEPSMDSDAEEDDNRLSNFEVAMQANLSSEMYQRYGVFEGDEEEDDEDGQSEGGDALAAREAAVRAQVAAESEGVLFEDNPLMGGAGGGFAVGQRTYGVDDGEDSEDSSDGGSSDEGAEEEEITITPSALGLDELAQQAGFAHFEDEAGFSGGDGGAQQQGGAANADEGDHHVVPQMEGLSVQDGDQAQKGMDFDANQYWKSSYTPGLSEAEMELLG